MSHVPAAQARSSSIVMENKEVMLCSACLLGVPCRYDGSSKINKRAIRLAKKIILIPVCPEQLGGLETPREPAEQKGNKVFTRSGENVTKKFETGAKQVLKIAKLFKVKKVILKQRSPSCGSGQIYDGSFSGNIISGDGVTVSFLKKNKITVISEDDLK